MRKTIIGLILLFISMTILIVIITAKFVCPTNNKYVDVPCRGAFYYQPAAAHWWFWKNFDSELYMQDIKKFKICHFDTITFDLQVKDFIIPSVSGESFSMNETTLNKLRFVINEAYKNGLKVMLVLWYTNGYDRNEAQYSGGARLVNPYLFKQYEEITRAVASVTKGYPVTFFFTNELFSFFANYDASSKKWEITPYEPASRSFIKWLHSKNDNLNFWNKKFNTSFQTWNKVEVTKIFPKREYWDWLAWVIRSRLPKLVKDIKTENPLALVGYEDFSLVYGWGDSGIPIPCPLDLIGFGIYRNMFISGTTLAEQAYNTLKKYAPGNKIFIPEVGMDTYNYSETEQEEWYRSILLWANKKGVGINVLMWRDYIPTSELPLLNESHFGIRHIDDSIKPVFHVFHDIYPKCKN